MTIPSPRTVKEAFPLSVRAKHGIEKSRSILRAIGQGLDKRLLIVAGPCSIHEVSSAKEYAKRYKALHKQVEESCFLVMRTFFEKSRTQHGWTGFLNDPHLNGSYNLQAGLFQTRELLVAFAEEGIPVCAEFLHPLVAPYCEDLVTLGIIGARTSFSQLHRHLASHLQMPVGFKNSMDGNIESALQGIATAQQSHHFLTVDEEGRICSEKTNGNPDGYLVLRGSQYRPNYDYKSIEDAASLAISLQLPHRLIVDCAHGNSGKCPDKQYNVFRSCLSYIEKGKQEIMGLMLESYLEKGTQTVHKDNPLEYGVSITDPCLDWDTTVELIHEAHSVLKQIPSYAIS